MAARQLVRATRPGRRRAWLVASLVANLGLLGTFKYFDFFMDNLGRLGESLFSLGSTIPHLDLVLPIGISFYTFQSMSYTIDVYRGSLRPVEGFWKFLLYVSFFPQLVAGPIVRARDFLYQLDRKRRARAAVWAEGAYLIIQDFFLKMVVADHCGALVDEYWKLGAGPEANGLLSLYTAVLFSCQIFADFSGYTNIARGIAYLLGFRLPLNFNAPYVASSFSGFWARWHMSLSSWLRDYLYIPLGGNRKGAARTYVNLALVMLLGGLWHGSANTFVVWGAIHGGALCIERWLGLNRERRSAILELGWALVVQAVVLAAWIFFRASSVPEATAILKSIVLGPHEPITAGRLLLSGFLLLTPVVLIHLRTLGFERLRLPRPSPVEKGALAALMAYLVLTAHAATNEFIYFQF